MSKKWLGIINLIICKRSIWPRLLGKVTKHGIFVNAWVQNLIHVIEFGHIPMLTNIDINLHKFNTCHDFNSISNYSWGSTVLAYLYHALDYEIDFNQDNIRGCAVLLQCWVYKHIKYLSPSIKRHCCHGTWFSTCEKVHIYLLSTKLLLQ